MTPEPLLRVEELSISAGRGVSALGVVDRVSFDVGAGEAVALVGESGCGKSVTALSILRLLEPPLAVTGGAIRFRGEDLTRIPERALRGIRGRRIAMVFQEPMTALNPVLTVGEQIVEVLELHAGLNRKSARARAVELLDEVRIPDPAQQLDEYPHRFSGGMRQRVLLAMALAGEPDLLIADEPTTALDVTVQAQILELLRALQERRGMSMLLITHDLGVVAETARRVLVMYAGRIVESAAVGDLFRAPAHPYTRALFRARPALVPPGERLEAIPGSVPAPGAYPAGCRFHPRCAEAFLRCDREVPRLLPSAGGGTKASPVPLTRVACFAREEGRDGGAP